VGHREVTEVARRSFLGGAAAAAAMPGVGIAAGLKVAQSPDPKRLFRTPEDHLRAYVKLVGSTAPEMLYTHYQGVLYSVIANEVPRPLVRFEALGKARWTPRPDGSFLRKSHDLGFFGDLETRLPIDVFRNPHTNRDVRPLHYKNGRGETLYTRAGPRLPWAGAQTGDKAATFQPDWTISGDEIWVDDEVSGERESWLSPKDWPQASAGEKMHIRSTVTSKGSVSELINPKVSAGRCTIIWTGLFPWLPWLLMGQRPGFLLWRSVGRKIRTPEEASQRILDFIAEREPGYLTSEDPWMDRKNSWIDYSKARAGDRKR
jgi:hypothetical protein